DTGGCIQPLCINCLRACIGSVHLTPDGGKVLYFVARQQPFYTVGSDGSGPARLPIYSGSLAPSPQRVISRNNQVVFTSSAPAGPTFASSATDVFLVNLDGTGIRQVTDFRDPGFYAFNATISADGLLIAFLSNYSPS